MIYILEDDVTINELVTYALKSQDLPAQGFTVPSDFWEAVASQVPDLVLLDIMLPEEDGISILKTLRQQAATHQVPIIMLTAKDSEIDAVLALDAGADDYVTKPFGMMELVSRVKANLRRRPATEQLQWADLTLYPQSYEVYCGDQAVELTHKEYQLLELLMRHPHLVFSRDQLLASLWGYDYGGETRTVDVHVRSLRKKLGASKYIRTVHGVGYKLGDSHDE